MGNSSFNVKVRKAIESQADDADIVVGIAPAPEGVAFNKFVLDYSVRRPLSGMSFFTEPGGQRHDKESYKAMREQIEEECSAMTDGLSAPWDLPLCTHNCWVIYQDCDAVSALLPLEIACVGLWRSWPIGFYLA